MARRAQLADGRILEFPDGTPDAVIDRVVRREIANPPEQEQEENLLEQVPIIGTPLAAAADIPLSAVEQLAGTLGTFSDVFGANNATSRFLRDVAEGAGDWRSSGSREDEATSAREIREAEGQGTWEETKAALRAFARSPLEMTAGALGSQIPYAAAAGAAALAAPETGGASLAALFGLLGAAGAGGVSGVGTIKGAVYDSTYQAAREHNRSEEEARALAERAQEYGGPNTDMMALGGALGALAGSLGIGKAVSRSIANRAVSEIARRAAENTARQSLVRGAARGAVAEAVPEAIQAGQERFAQNLAVQRAGYDTDLFKGVAGQAALEGIASLIPGAIGGRSEAKSENLYLEREALRQTFDALPERPTEADIDSEVQRLVEQRGYTEDVARRVVNNMAASKRALEEQAANAEKLRQAAMDARTTGFTPPTDEDIIYGQPPAADEEELAAMQRFYEDEVGSAPDVGGFEPSVSDIGGQATTGAGTAAPTGPAPGGMERAGADVAGAGRGAGARESALDELDLETAYKAQQAPKAERFISPEQATAMLSDDDVVDRFAFERGLEYNEAVGILREVAQGGGRQIRYSRRGPRPKDTQTPNLFDMQLQQAPGEELKRQEYNEQRFASEADKLARQEQAAQEREAGLERAARLGEQEAAQRQRHLDFIQSILRGKAPENAVYKVLYEPEDTNAPYKLVAETRLGKKPELVLQAKTRQEFSDAVYEQMEELTPYTPETATAMEEIEPRESFEQEAPTVATRMVQEFTAEVDAARKAGQINDNQRAELLRRLQRPNAYRSVNGRTVANDDIAKLEEAALEAASVERNALAEDKEAAAAARSEANKRLSNAVKNSLLNPARAALKSMVEMRQDEKVGAKVRLRGARSVIDKFAEQVETQEDFALKRGKQGLRYERVPGKRTGAEQIGIEGIGETKAEPAQRSTLRRKKTGTAATDEAVFGALSDEETAELREAKAEERDAKIDLAEQRVSKYRKGAEKEPGGPPKVVSVGAVQDMVDAITAVWKSPNPVVVVESIMDIKDGKLRAAIMRDNALDADGLIAPDGTIYLVADNLTSLEDAKSVLFHEALGHLGLEKLFRNNLDNALVTMYRGNAKLKADTDKWRQDNPGAYENDTNPLARAVEEVLAERSEAGQLERSLFQKIAAIVRNFARRMGISLKISDGDVAAILAMAHDKVVRGDAESAIVKGLRYVNVWHGSPHSFDKFSTDFINTGEGAQMYGWGLYFTDTKQIAESTYRDRLAGYQFVADGKPLSEWADENLKSLGVPYTQAVRSIEKYLPQYASVQEMLDSTRLSLEQEGQRLAEVEAEAARERGPEDEDYDGYIRSVKNTISRWSREVAVLEKLVDAKVEKKSAGKLYNVELAPKDDEWLLWDAPLSEQSDKVKAALEKLGVVVPGKAEVEALENKFAAVKKAWENLWTERRAEFRKLGIDTSDATLTMASIRPNLNNPGYERARELTVKMDQLADYNNAIAENLNIWTNKKGYVYSYLEGTYGSPKAASLALLAAGVRGNKYLDGFSRGARGADNPTYNYVLFTGDDAEIVAKYSRPKTSKATAKKLSDSEADMSEGLRRTQKSVNTNGIVDGLEQTIKGRNGAAFIDGLKENYESLSAPLLAKTLRVMPTSGILNWFDGRIPSLREIDKLVNEMVNMKANIIKAADPIAKVLDEFLVTDTDQRLAQAMSIFRINELSPEDLANNKVLKEVERRILANANNKQAAQKLIDEIKDLVNQRKSAVQVEGDKIDLAPAVRTKIGQLTKDAVDGTKTSDQGLQLVEITRRIRDAQQAWDELGKLENGHKLYRAIRDFYKDMFESELALLDARIDNLMDEREAKRLKDLRADMMREALNPEEAKKKGDVLWDIDSSLFSKDYFPFMRAGKYWLRVAADKKGTREREFYTFESARERDKAKRAVARRLGVDPKDASVITVGNDVEELQNDLRSEDAMMQKVFDLVGDVKAKMLTSGVISKTDVKELTDSIYQTWLLSTPERSVRRRFMHAEEVVGFQQDVLRQFSSQVTTYANQLSKLAYVGDIRTKISEARDTIGDSERPNDEQAKLNTVVSEFESRVEQEVNPDPQSAVVNLLNRASYFYYLTSARTALIQTVSIPLRVLPRLWRDYGFNKGTAIYLKYMKLWKTLGTARTETIKTSFGDQLHAIMPSLTGSSMINAKTERGALLRRAMKAGEQRNALETVLNTMVQNERETARRHKTGISRTVSTAAEGAANVMSVLFQGMENISRQAAYFMTFELAYDDYLAKNPGDKDGAFEHAVEKAINVARDTLGDYTNWERPSVAKNNWTRALFLFKMYPIVQTKFMVGAARDIIKGTMPGATAEAKAERAGAMKELAGVTMMAGVFGGIMGMPLYSLLAYALAEGFDEEDDEDVRALMGMDPRTAYDSDLMFRTWMADTFGTPEVGDVDLADILTYGPIGALTDTDIGGSTSLDLKNMWFREAVAGDSTFQTLIKMAMSNIAGLNMLSSFVSGYDNFIEGDIYGGLKKGLPAFFRTWVAAAQGEAEGVQTSRGDMLIAPEDITAFDTMRTITGFRPLRLSQLQDYTITRAKNEKRILAERTSLLARLDQDIRDGVITSMDDLREYWQEEIVPFNRTYPDENFVITPETIENSLKRRAERRERTIQGMVLDTNRATARKDFEAARAFRLE